MSPKKTVSLLLLSLMTPAAALASLSPYHQSAAEIRAIIDSDEVADKLGAVRAITSVSKVPGGYQVTTEDCTLLVGIRFLPLPPHYAGPSRFEVVAEEPATCLPGN